MSYNNKRGANIRLLLCLTKTINRATENRQYKLTKRFIIIQIKKGCSVQHPFLNSKSN